MKYIITDWISNLCFDSESKEFETFDDASEYLDECLRKEFGEDCDLEEEREEFFIHEYVEGRDRIMWTGTRYMFRENYYKGAE